MILDVSIFVFLIILLLVSSVYTTKSISKITSYLKLEHFAAGFLIMAISTTIPELIVGFESALAGMPVLSFGDILGSNIINLTLVIGIVTLISGGAKFRRDFIRDDSKYMFFIALLPILLALDQNLSRLDGIILLAVFSTYILMMLKRNRSRELESTVSKVSFLKNGLLFVVSIISLLISAQYLIYYASLIATEIGISLLAVGIFMVAFGTSLPELAFETVAMMHGYKYLAIGDLMGSTVANSSLVLGLVALINPILIVNFNLFLLSSIFFVIILFSFVMILKSKDGITRVRALFLISIYILFLIVTGISIW